MMTYKETLFFVGKCLTITHEKHNRILVEEELKSGKVDWDNVVKLSTSHYVFPALYCNLKRADFLHYLPNDLVDYMKHITDLNRERNQQIIEQAKEINELLLANNITPIFLKGTGNLLEGLYEDIAERMVGDIDFIFSEKEYPKAIKILTNNKYAKVNDLGYDFPLFKHHPRLQQKNRIAAVEIHKELLKEKYADKFNYSKIKETVIKLDGITFMSYSNQLCLSIIAKQINDDGFLFKNIALRNAYDVFLLSKKTNAKKAFDNYKKLYNPLNCFLAICYKTFGNIDSLIYHETPETIEYLNIFKNHVENDSLRKKKHRKTAKKIFLKDRFKIIYQSIFNKAYRNWLLKRITDKEWQYEKLIQLGIKKPKPNA